MAPAYHGHSRLKWRIGYANTRGEIVRVRRDGFQKLQIVAQSQVECEPRVELPLILRKEAEIGIRLRNHGGAKRLSEACIVVSAIEKVTERRECVSAPARSRIRDRRVIL